MAKILVTGGTGLIGQHLCRTLVRGGHDVGVLSRSKVKSIDPPVTNYYWDIENGYIDADAVKRSDFIIHLAGSNIGSKRWSDKRKKNILDSRIKSAELIFRSLESKNNLKAFISSSAIGYYGAVTSDEIFTENDQPANDFLGVTCSMWEHAADMFGNKGVRVVKIRTGIVLIHRGGALSRFMPLSKIGLGSGIGSGNQYMPWIHINDLTEIFRAAIENDKMVGAFNAVAPEHITNNEFARTISLALRRPFWFPNVPAFIVRLLFGEMSEMILNGSRVSSKKIENTGFEFEFRTLEAAMQSIIIK